MSFDIHFVIYPLGTEKVGPTAKQREYFPQASIFYI